MSTEMPKKTIIIFLVWLALAAASSQVNKTFSTCKLGQQLSHNDRNGRLKFLVCSEKIKGVPQWKFVDGSSTLGEIFNPAQDCSDVVNQLPEATDGFYWIRLPKGTNHKVWCDVHTDGGGFMLVGMKDSPVSWTVPSNSNLVDPNGPPHWSSVLGDVKVLDFRVTFSSDKSFDGKKADWMYRLKPRREFGNLFSINNGCPLLEAGIGNVSFVKDLMTETVVTNTFKCSKFGQHIHPDLGWGRMNYCLRHLCPNGFAIIDGLNLRYDNFGSYSFSATSQFSGIKHNSTAFVGCDQGECCACFGPEGGIKDYCGPKCTAFNGGKIVKKAFVWFWVRNQVPSRLWKRCMEFKVKSLAGKDETHYIDLNTGTAHKGSCSEQFTALFNDGTLTVSDRESMDKIPAVPGFVLYREDEKQLYYNNGSKWQAISTKAEVEKLQHDLSKQQNMTRNAELKIQELKTQIKMQEAQDLRQVNKIYSQQNENRKQENEIKQLQKGYQDMVSRLDSLQPPSTCSALLKKFPSARSGLYDLNPQGFVPFATAQVYCDMTSNSGVGVTVIGHDSESRTFVNGYESPGSYKQRINYDIHLEQIVAIIKQSKNCEQYIKYECHHDRLFLDGGYGWWVSRQGWKMNYWGGAAVNSGKCACGMTNSCAGGFKCNCDKNDKTWREDSGYLTDKSTLPVTELRFGDTGTSFEKGYHTLGKLRCWG